MIDFSAISNFVFLFTLIIGWAVINLPNIIEAFQKLFKFITRVVTIFTNFIDGMKDFFTSIGDGVQGVFKKLTRFDFEENTKKIREMFDQLTGNLVNLNKAFVSSIFGFVNDENIRKAPEAAQKLGINQLPNDKEEDLPAVLTQSAIENKQKEIESRDEGGNVVEGESYLIGLNPETGEPDERTETFIPTEDGVIANNQETDELIKGQQNVPDDETLETENDEMNEDEQKVFDFLNSGDDTSSKASGATGVSGGGEDTFQIENEIKMDKKSLEEKNKKSKKDKKDVAENIKPSKRQVKNLKGVKKSKTRTVVIEKPVPMGGGGRVQPMVNSGNTVVQNRQSDISTLLKLQSGSTLKYT